MDYQFNLQEYLTNGVEKIVKDAIKATLKNPKESFFFTKYAKSCKKAAKLRNQSKEQGENIPPFLIASITGSCNLHCAGCYSRANHACLDGIIENQLTAYDWDKIFNESRELGISFILLAGGEPMLRKDVIRAAADYPEIIFPIFTNGTMFDDEYIDLFDSNRNLIPVISIEGGREETDARRGNGVYKRIIDSVNILSRRQLAFGVSITVTTENISEVISDAFLKELSDLGTKIVFFVEFVPVSPDLRHLAPGDTEREFMNASLQSVREKFDEMILISFPGDEKASGGCLAAGRGFFHINSKGGAEPCPFSPYSDINVRDTSVREALRSRLFERLKNDDVLLEDHAGGCVLFEKREAVEKILCTSGVGPNSKST